VEVKAIHPTHDGCAERHVLQLGLAALDAPEIRRGVRVL